MRLVTAKSGWILDISGKVTDHVRKGCGDGPLQSGCRNSGFQPSRRWEGGWDQMGVPNRDEREDGHLDDWKPEVAAAAVPPHGTHHTLPWCTARTKLKCRMTGGRHANNMYSWHACNGRINSTTVTSARTNTDVPRPYTYSHCSRDIVVFMLYTLWCFVSFYWVQYLGLTRLGFSHILHLYAIQLQKHQHYLHGSGIKNYKRFDHSTNLPYCNSSDRYHQPLQAKKLGFK